MKLDTRIFALFALALGLAACAPTAPPATQPVAGAPSPAPTRKATQPVQNQSGVPTHEPGCSVVSSRSTPNPTVESLLPAPTDQDWSRGPKDAAVTIIDYSDFQ